MLSRINLQKKVPQAICIAPTRELARQIYTVVLEMGQFTGLQVRILVPLEKLPKETPIQEQIIIGTPGTVLQCISRRSTPGKFTPDEISVLVLDEADVMIDSQGHGTQSLRIKSLLPRNAQILLFSATFHPKVITRIP